MNLYNTKLYEARADIIKALAHPSRLFIVDMLNDGRAQWGELYRDDRG
jgi:DNA-binding transcriptional ArsR family regulator